MDLEEYNAEYENDESSGYEVDIVCKTRVLVHATSQAKAEEVAVFEVEEYLPYSIGLKEMTWEIEGTIVS